MSQNKFVDPWRSRIPQTKTYSFFSQVRRSYSHIDSKKMDGWCAALVWALLLSVNLKLKSSIKQTLLFSQFHSWISEGLYTNKSFFLPQNKIFISSPKDQNAAQSVWCHLSWSPSLQCWTTPLYFVSCLCVFVYFCEFWFPPGLFFVLEMVGFPHFQSVMQQ